VCVYIQGLGWKADKCRQLLEIWFRLCRQTATSCAHGYEFTGRSTFKETYFTWCCPSIRRQTPSRKRLPCWRADQMNQVSATGNLGVFVDAELSMRSHISATENIYFSGALQNYWLIAHFPEASILQVQVHSLHSPLPPFSLILPTPSSLPFLLPNSPKHTPNSFSS